MAWLALVANVAGLTGLAVAFAWGVVLLVRSSIAQGMGLIIVAGGVFYAGGWAAAYDLWINIQAPKRLWQKPPVAVVGPEISMGDTVPGVRSFQGDVELYATAVTVRCDDGDLVISALRFEVLKRSVALDPVAAGVLRARVYGRNLRQHSGTRSSGVGVVVDLSRGSESPGVPVTLRLSNLEPYRVTESAEFRIRGGAASCVPDCGIGFALLYGAKEAATTAIHVRQR